MFYLKHAHNDQYGNVFGDAGMQASASGINGGMDLRDGLDASGRKPVGKGVYQFVDKYGANVDGYSPIYNESEWSLSGDVYVGDNFHCRGSIPGVQISRILRPSNSEIDLGSHGIATSKDYSRKLGDYVDIYVLNAIQRIAAKAWVSDKPYHEDACLPDFGIFIIDQRKLENYMIDAIIWWTKVLNLQTERKNQRKSAIALSIYDKYFRLPPSWKLSTSVTENATNMLLKKVCSDDEHQQQDFHLRSIWQRYLPQSSDAILNHQS